MEKIPHKHAEVIKAWADGAEIEYRSNGYTGWCDATTPNWAEHLEYRVKRKKVLVYLYTNGERYEAHTMHKPTSGHFPNNHMWKHVNTFEHTEEEE